MYQNGTNFFVFKYFIPVGMYTRSVTQYTIYIFSTLVFVLFVKVDTMDIMNLLLETSVEPRTGKFEDENYAKCLAK